MEEVIKGPEAQEKEEAARGGHPGRSELHLLWVGLLSHPAGQAGPATPRLLFSKDLIASPAGLLGGCSLKLLFFCRPPVTHEP